MKNILIITLLVMHLFPVVAIAQIKTIIEDFEGYADGQSNFAREGLFSYGAATLMTEQKATTGFGYSGKRALKVSWAKNLYYGGFGKGLGVYKELNVDTDYFNFYVLNNNANPVEINLVIEDDDNNNSIFEPEADDQWAYTLGITNQKDWQLVSVPLKNFKKIKGGGDSKFNINYKEGKLLTIVFDFTKPQEVAVGDHFYFDFINISDTKFAPEHFWNYNIPVTEASCAKGFWSEEGNSGNPQDIIKALYTTKYMCVPQNKIGVISFYKPFSVDENNQPNLYPNINDINLLITQGYLPLITFEAKHINKNSNAPQPNLYSINEGWYDHYFESWAQTIKQVNGSVLIRILHEFNGNWYPWCITNNDGNSQLYIKAFQRIVDIFKKNEANNVKWVWCPNSISTPQESWNNFLNAYPGDAYVDYVGLDIFNGAGQAGTPQWRSFRHEGMDAYYAVTNAFPSKPLLLCETASRERDTTENGYYTTKSDWIKAQAEALKTDMNKFKLIVWFNETTSFRTDSSPESYFSYLQYLWKDPYFNGTPKQLLEIKK